MNIFNILNDDNPLTKILDGSVGWYRYGRKVTGSAQSVLSNRKNTISKILGDKYKADNTDKGYKGSPNVVKRILDGIVSKIQELIRNTIDFFSNMLISFTNTEPIEYIPPIEYKEDNSNIQNMIDGRENSHKAMVQNIEMHTNGPDTIASKDGASMEGADINKENKNTYVAPGAELAPALMNGYAKGIFVDSYELMEYSTNKNRINFNYQRDLMDGNYECIRLINSNVGLNCFKYSNYTIPDNEGIIPYDISFSQFWNKDEEKLKDILSKYHKTTDDTHYSLYKNNAGDFSKSTTDMIFGRYHKGFGSNNEFQQQAAIYRINKVDSDGGELINLYDGNDLDCDVALVDGRILAAAPLHLLLATDKLEIKDLYEHKMFIENRYGANGNGTYLQSDTKADNIASKNKDFRYMDLVIESINGYQYVVPFMVVDVKDLHNNNGGHYATITDNTYGHVYEEVTNNVNGEEVRRYLHMNPIEPYLKLMKKQEDGSYDYFDGQLTALPNGGRSASQINSLIKNFILGNSKDKIVSMRLYDKQYDEANSSWWRDKRDSLMVMPENDYKEDVENGEFFHEGKVVNYNLDGGITE